MPLVSVISIERARMTRFSTESGSPAADDEFVTTSDRTRAGKRSANRSGDPGAEREAADVRLPDAQAVEHRLEVEHPPLERVLRGIFGATRSRVAARLPENQPVAGGQRVAVDVPHLDVAADAVGEHERRPLPCTS